MTPKCVVGAVSACSVAMTDEATCEYNDETSGLQDLGTQTVKGGRV